MGNETTFSSQYISGICLPKIIQIDLAKLWLIKDGDVFFETRFTDKF